MNRLVLTALFALLLGCDLRARSHRPLQSEEDGETAAPEPAAEPDAGAISIVSDGGGVWLYPDPELGDPPRADAGGTPACAHGACRRPPRGRSDGPGRP